MNAKIAIINSNSIVTSPTPPNYMGMLDVLLSGFSLGTRRQYEYTYSDWVSWCKSSGVNQNEINAVNVMNYLYHKPLSRGTRKSRLCHFRVLVRTLFTADTSNRSLEQIYTQLKMIKLSIDDVSPLPNTAKAKRKGQRLDPGKVHELINDYPVKKNEKPYLRGLRNRALLAVLFYAGLRRFEAAKLKWADIDFEREQLHVVGGKGRERNSVDYVPFIGAIARHLKAWCEHSVDREYVFPRVLKGDHLGEDKPITPDAIYKQFEADFAPHDARRTLISDLLDSGTYIADVKAIARHTSEVTTLRYAMSHKTSEIKGRVKIGY